MTWHNNVYIPLQQLFRLSSEFWSSDGFFHWGFLCRRVDSCSPPAQHQFGFAYRNWNCYFGVDWCSWPKYNSTQVFFNKQRYKIHVWHFHFKCFRMVWFTNVHDIFNMLEQKTVSLFSRFHPEWARFQDLYTRYFLDIFYYIELFFFKNYNSYVDYRWNFSVGNDSTKFVAKFMSTQELLSENLEIGRASCRERV